MDMNDGIEGVVIGIFAAMLVLALVGLVLLLKFS